MKKVYLGLLAFSLVGMLAACSGGPTNKDYVVQEGSSVVTEQLMKANYNQNEPEEKVTLQAYEFKLPEGYTPAYPLSPGSGTGYQMVSKDGKYGVYSILANKLILDARLAEQPTFYQNELFGFEFYYHETVGAKEMYYLADGAGNIIYQAENEFTRLGYNHNFNYDKNDNRTVYTVHLINNAELDDPVVSVFHKYDEHNKATVTDAYAYYDYAKVPAGTPYEQESIYDLSIVGLETTMKTFNYKSNTLIKIYGKDGAVLATFDFPQGYSFHIAGKKLFAQRVYAPSFNVGMGGDTRVTGSPNTSVSTCVINLETYERKDIEFPGVLTSIDKLVNPENNENEYYVVRFTELRDDKTLGAKRVMILDKEYAFHDDITRKNFVDWLRLSNGYFYDEGNDVLYNAEFTPVLDASGNDIYFYKDREVFYNSLNPYGYETYNNEGKRTYANEYVLSDNDPLFNTVYEAVNFEKQQDGYYLDIATGAAYKLVDETKEGVTTEEHIRDTIFVEKKVTETSPAKVSGSLRTVDGQQLFTIAEKLESDIDVDNFFEQPEDHYEKPSVFYVASMTVNAEQVGYVIYNKLLEANVITVPNAA